MLDMRRGHILGGTLFVSIVVLCAAGCDRRSGASAGNASDGDGTKAEAVVPAPGAEPPVASTRPTTQELLTGPTKRIGLQVVPLSAQVPQSWEIRTLKIS